MDRVRPQFKLFFSALICLLASLLATYANAATIRLPQFTGSIVDNANIITEDSRRQIASEIAAIKSDTSVNLVVVTVDYLQGYDIADYGARLADVWDLGSGRLNNGVLLIIAPHERKIRIQVEDGLNNVLTDSVSRNIIKIAIAPKFQSDDVNQGIIDGVNAIHSALMDTPYEGNYQQNTSNSPAKNSAAASNDKSNSSDSGEGGKSINIIWIVALIFIFLVIVAQSSGSYGYYPRRRYGRDTYIVPPVVYEDPVRGRRYDDFGGGSSGRW